MSLAALLSFTTNTQQTYNLVECKFRSSKHFNTRTHHPDAEAKCGVVELTVIPEPLDFTFYDWYIDNTILSGSIVFDLLLNDNDKKKLKFVNAYCISLAESYSIADNKQKVLKLEFIAQSMSVIASSTPNQGSETTEILATLNL